MSTTMMNASVPNERGVKSVLIPALDYMRIDKNGEPDAAYIKSNLEKRLAEYPDAPHVYHTRVYLPQCLW